MDFKIIYNNIIPFKGYKALLFFKWLFVRKGAKISYAFLTHEGIHYHQQMEVTMVALVIFAVLGVVGCGWWSLLAIPLYFWMYILEWLIRIPISGTSGKAYRNVSFEKEAYTNERDCKYLENRKHFAWVTYLFN